MKIYKVEVENFRQYREKSEILFSTNKEKNLNILIGENGEGKTNLFKAINWCLFGETDDSLEIVNKESLKEGLLKNKQVEVRVVIIFYQDGLKYKINRELTATKIKEVKEEEEEGVRYEYVDEEYAFLTYWNRKKESTTYENDDMPAVMSSILSKRLRKYFLFDAEKMDELTKEGQEESVKRGIKDMLRFEVIERAIKHLEKAKDSYDNEVKHGFKNTDLQEAIELKEKLKKRIDKNKEELEDKEKEIEKVKNFISNLTLKINKSGGKEAIQLNNQIGELSDQLTEKEGYMSDAFDVFSSKINSCYRMMCGTIVHKAMEKIHKLRVVEKKIPSIPKEDIIKIMDNGKCICGLEFKDVSGKPDKKSKAYLTLMKEVEGKLSQDVQIQVENINAGASTLQEVRKTLIEQIRGRLQDYETYEGNIIEIKKKIKNLKGELGQSEKIVKKAKEFQQQREGFEKNRDKLLDEKSEIKVEIKQDKKQLEMKREEITKLLEAEEEGKSVKKHYLLAENSHKLLGQVYDEYCKEMRERVQVKTQEIFSNLIWKDSQFKEVLISEDYQLEVLDKFNTVARKELSAGERQILSLSFILALSIETNLEAPFIVDTPLGRISGKNRRNIAKYLPKYAKQLFLIVTPDEINNPEMSELKSHVGSWWKIKFDNGRSKIIKK